MDEQLDYIKRRLTEAKEQRGRLARIAEGSLVTSRTIYSLMHGKKPSAKTADKIASYLKKYDAKYKKEKTV